MRRIGLGGPQWPNSLLYIYLGKRGTLPPDYWAWFRGRIPKKNGAREIMPISQAAAAPFLGFLARGGGNFSGGGGGGGGPIIRARDLILGLTPRPQDPGIRGPIPRNPKNKWARGSCRRIQGLARADGAHIAAITPRPPLPPHSRILSPGYMGPHSLSHLSY
jgi:hypothetical protein